MSFSKQFLNQYDKIFQKKLQLEILYEEFSIVLQQLLGIQKNVVVEVLINY